jgi:hypothetical protein
MNEVNVGAGMKEVNLKDAQATFQKTITYIKKFSEGRLGWEKACPEGGMQHKKLKTLVKIHIASKATLFQETLEYANAINICYTQQSSTLRARVPNGLTWAIT